MHATSRVSSMRGMPVALTHNNNIEKPKDPAVWRYFTLGTVTTSTATCNICKGNVATAGGSTTKYNTTNVIKDLQKHHAKDHAKLLQLNKTKGDNTTK